MSLFHKDLDRAETKVLKRCRRYDFVLEIYKAGTDFNSGGHFEKRRRPVLEKSCFVNEHTNGSARSDDKLFSPFTERRFPSLSRHLLIV